MLKESFGQLWEYKSGLSSGEPMGFRMKNICG